MALRFSDLLLAQEKAENHGSASLWQLSFVVSLTVTVCLILLNSTGLFQILEWAIFDQYFRLRPQEAVDSRLLLVTIDEPDISHLQQWPLSDERLAQVLKQIDQYQPSVIGLDIYRDFSVPPGENILEEVFRNTPNLIGVEKIGHKPVDSSPTLAERGQVAMADVVMDDDGTVRRALLSANINDELRWSLGSAAALLYLNQKGIILETRPFSDMPSLGNVSFPRLETNGGGYVNASTTGYQTLLNFRGPDDAFESISITDVLEGKLSELQVRDRIVFIGSIAPSLNDFVYTPYNKSALTQTSQSPGVAVHAHTASQMVSAVLDGRILIQTWPTAVEWGWAFLWCTLGSGLILIRGWRRQSSLSAFISIGIPILALSFSLLLINTLLFLIGWWMPTMPALLGLTTSSIVSLVTDNSKLLKDAYIDGLTNVLNRRAFNQQLIKLQKVNHEIAIILCDVDYFKGFNDVYGHPAGDNCLKQVVQSIQQAVRSQDTLARYGGEEFAVILQNVSPEKACEIAERMREKVQSCQIPHVESQVSPYVSISCGVATRLANSNRPLSQILILADQALYQAKHSGRNQIALSDCFDEASNQN